MKNILNLDQIGLIGISYEDATIINGGSYESGQAAGKAVRKFVDNVLTIIGLAALFL